MIKKIYNGMENSTAIQKMRTAMTSEVFMIIQCVIAAVFVSFSSKDDFTSIVYGDILFATVCSFALIVCEDIIATLMPFLLISAMSIKCYDSFDVFIKFVWFAPVLALAIIFHFVVYHKKFELGAIWKGTLFVGIAVTLGGLGKITVPEYFSGTALFYTTGLGLGMFAIYMLLNAQYTYGEKYDMRKKFSLIMTMVGLFCVYMIVNFYIANWSTFVKSGSTLAFQWRNNVSTILMLTFPFGFFLSSKKYPFIIAGFLQYIGIMLTGSRGGTLFGTIELGICLLVFLLADKPNRKKNLIVIGILWAIVLALAQPVIRFLLPVIKRFATENSVRLGLFSRAIEDFKSNPLFGRGLGYMGNTDVHDPAKFALCWYHSAPFQVIGSFGIAGILAFSYQLYNRMRVLFERITLFNLTLFVAYAGLFMMSLVNPGEFSPIPYGMIATLFFVLCDKNNKYEALDKNKEEVLKIKVKRK
ncbi:MAG: O-antigen ligase family protein [Clostridia bacterium]|nr:O-antigen ligase family protein [Clostridia bacterium]